MAYNPGMSSSELFLDFTVDQNGKDLSPSRVKVGYGVVATSTLASAKTVTPALAKDDFQKVITEKYSADIHFLINRANIRANQTNKADYIDLNKRLMEANQAPNQEIAAININSYASPGRIVRLQRETRAETGKEHHQPCGKPAQKDKNL